MVSKVYVAQQAWHGYLTLYAWPVGPPGMQLWCLLPPERAGESTMQRVARWMRGLPKNQEARRPKLTRDWKLVTLRGEPESPFSRPEDVQRDQ